ncbi:universal stress protein [Sinomicrobium kalidii]|uniref:universal stress protein n=1 Tax=Sinomicrobium kalidii TaxID=2900738 RepID=UPI001E3161BF|nr:universal stress protein [Sinomicrobium kalidii]UGU16092.1 universal stress protein [Sinomicrobium kalidii]
MEKILIPTDFSDNAWNAVSYALKLFKDSECTFYLLHVLPPTLGSRETMASEVTDEMLSRAKVTATEKLEKWAEKMISSENKGKHKTEILTKFDLFTDAVDDIVSEKKIDMVVMGSRGAGGIKGFFLGSSTSNLIGHVKCPILAVPKDLEFEPVDEIGFAVDYEFAYDKKGLEPVFRIAEKFSSDIRFYHVMEKKDEWNGEKEKIREGIKKAFKGFNASFYLLTDVPLDVATRLFVESREIDLLCMAAEKRNFLDHLLGKSPVKNISYHSTTPLLVLHKDTLR